MTVLAVLESVFNGKWRSFARLPLSELGSAAQARERDGDDAYLCICTLFESRRGRISGSEMAALAFPVKNYFKKLKFIL